eukprot:gnl/MRDRNA2_/MRDRNA2_389108_c0_seq1.p1 gnl/MRDRNA2_/MRDRNA2_389108_c0~~gnl/MRDRNA2_/MRDRNA2_389108_c0_seq1.p1  ORF type:complete len:174 (+),score=29.17 gnl/MRDRNA2_/MRDRNA2_389108_c0_seq1:41-523(+)
MNDPWPTAEEDAAALRNVVTKATSIGKQTAIVVHVSRDRERDSWLAHEALAGCERDSVQLVIHDGDGHGADRLFKKRKALDAMVKSWWTAAVGRTTGGGTSDKPPEGNSLKPNSAQDSVSDNIKPLRTICSYCKKHGHYEDSCRQRIRDSKKGTGKGYCR